MVRMNCWNEQTLQWAVRRLLESQADPRGVLEGQTSLGEDSAKAVQDVVRHLTDCACCRQLARDLLDFELASRKGESTRMVLALEEIRPLTQSVSREEEQDEPEYAVAADAGPSREELPLDGHTAISLSTKDGRFLVRIFRDEKGGGATAVLLRNEAVPAVGNVPAPGVSLVIDGTDYPFDSAGIVQLPTFPAAPPCLVVDQSRI
jgi:hypothetical protein